MGILLIGNFLSRSTGIRGVSEDLADCLSDRGWVVITSSHKIGRLARLIDILLTIWVRRSEYHFAHVEVYSGLAFSLAEIACFTLKVVGKPYLLTLHGGNLPSFSRRWPGRVRRLLDRAKVVITPSNYLYEKMQIYRKDLQLISNAISLDNYRFQLRKYPKPNLIWLRSLHEIYNPGLAISVLRKLIRNNADIKLTMVGPDKSNGNYQKIQRLADQLGVRDQTAWVGGVPKSDVPYWLNKGDIFLNTANIDNTPVSILEAMACGLCVVSTNVGGIPFLLDDEEDALLVPPNDPEAMADAVDRILTEPNLAMRLSQNARHKAEQFDWSVILPKWEALFSEIIGKQR